MDKWKEDFRMAKSTKKLEKELKRGSASFKAWGQASVTEDTFGEPQVSKKSTYKYVRVNLPVKISEGRTIYVEMMGGYDPAKPILKRFSKEQGEGMMDIKWEHRKQKEIIDSVALSQVISIRIERNEQGKLIQKRFLSEIDASEYLAEHLQDGAEIYVGGEVQYSRYDGKIQRKYSVRTISLNEGYTDKDGNEKEPHEHEAIIRQSYLLDDTSLSRKWAKELENDGETKMSAWVAQYIGKEDGVEIKKTLPLAQEIVIRPTDEPEKLKKVLENILKVPKNVVREIVLKCKIIDGYTQGTGDVEITQEVQELIDCGLMTEEEVVQETTVRGTRISELVFQSPALALNDGVRKLLSEDKYDPEVLIVPEYEDDEDEDTDDSAADGGFKDDDLGDLSEDDLTDLFN